MRRFAKQVGVALLLSAATCAVIALPNDIGRPSQKDQQKVAQKIELAEQDAAEDIILHYRWDGEDTPHVYYENVNDSGQQTISYPGIPMKDTDDGWYSYTIEDADSADIVFSIGDAYVTATMNRVAGEWWFDQDTWYSWNPYEEKEDENISFAQKEDSKTSDVTTSIYTSTNDGDGKYSKKNVNHALNKLASTILYIFRLMTVSLKNLICNILMNSCIVRDSDVESILFFI